VCRQTSWIKASSGDRHRRDKIAIAQAGLATTHRVDRSAGKTTGCRPDPISVLTTLRKALDAPRLLPEEARRLQQAVAASVNGLKDREELLGTCPGIFLVLAGARIARYARAQIRLSANLSNKGPFTDLDPPIKNPARSRVFYWRTERDSNPRTAFTVTHFPGVRLQPLGHLSALEWGKYTVGPVPASYLKIKGFWPETGLFPGPSLALRAFAARNGPPDQFVRAGRANHSSQARPSSCDKRLFGL
jgi:hypothetical protein